MNWESIFITVPAPKTERRRSMSTWHVRIAPKISFGFLFFFLLRSFLLKTFISLFSGLNFPKLILINWKTVPIAGKALLVGWQNMRRRGKAFALSREEEKVFPPSTDKTIKHDKCCAWRQRGGIVTRWRWNESHQASVSELSRKQFILAICVTHSAWFLVGPLDCRRGRWAGA